MMERKWVMVAFLDLSNFRSWTYRASTAPEDKEQFLEQFYAVLQYYVKIHLCAWSKYEGDGLLVVHEFTSEDRKNPRNIADFVLGLRTLTRKVQTVLRNAESCPDGVRIRIMDGYVFKIMVLDPNDPDRQRRIPEYLEYCMNAVRGLLGVNPEVACLATAGVVKSLGRVRSPLRVRPHTKPSCYPKGVNREDVEKLYNLNF